VQEAVQQSHAAVRWGGAAVICLHHGFMFEVRSRVGGPRGVICR
jgi:hypothetical protein